jgi:hypothetical protein
MAWITNFELKAGSGRLQPSHVVGFVKVFSPADSSPIVQIDTQGSADRANPGKQSQAIQLGREAARELFELLKQTYGFN